MYKLLQNTKCGFLCYKTPLKKYGRVARSRFAGGTNCATGRQLFFLLAEPFFFISLKVKQVDAEQMNKQILENSFSIVNQSELN